MRTTNMNMQQAEKLYLAARNKQEHQRRVGMMREMGVKVGEEEAHTNAIQ